MHERLPRAPLPSGGASESEAVGLSHEQLVRALREVDGLIDVSPDRPNFHFRGRAFLHFHHASECTYADVRFGGGDFEPVWASTPVERAALLARVGDHVERLQRSRKGGRRSTGERDGRAVRANDPPTVVCRGSVRLGSFGPPSVSRRRPHSKVVWMQGAAAARAGRWPPGAPPDAATRSRMKHWIRASQPARADCPRGRMRHPNG